ncbi:MAG TPA: B12-binding domain-containing radical SAM protein [Spirochaetota bacterium]|nr:B12-binding domain-containing radical SAM protein [Spirochaetota bacterium]HQE58387.1 B12-binding domain-containing radical SAM protein [Spirochaetota bacterium]
MKKKILLVYPEIPSTYWGMKHALAFINKKASTIPLGLITVAALLPEDYDLKLIDMNVQKLKKKDIAGCDIVMISAMIVQSTSFASVVKMCRDCGVKVAAGGPYPTTSYKQICDVDYFILNEAEITLPSFIRDFEAGNPEHVYTTTEKPDITLTPVPRYDLLKIKRYNNLALQNSRGCPFNCEFCDIIELFGRVPRLKTPAQFASELTAVYETGFRGSVFIVDDNFIGNRSKVISLLQEIIKWQKIHKNPFTFFTEASINLATDDEMLGLMNRARFDMVFTGIETPDSASLSGCHKTQNLKTDLLESVKKIQKNGIEVSAGFIVGFDSDKDDIFDRQIEFIQRSGVSMAMVGLLTALPGTQLYRRLKEEGRLKASVAASGNNTHDLQMNFQPVMNENKLVDGYERILREIYSPEKYFKRSAEFIKRLPPKRISNFRIITYSEIRALVLSFIKQGFSSYGFKYFKFLVYTLFRNPGYFAQSVSIAVKGYHFFKITKDIVIAKAFCEQADSVIDELKSRMTETFEKTKAASLRDIDLVTKEIVFLRKRMMKKYSGMNYDLKKYLEHLHRQFDVKTSEMIENLRVLRTEV